MWAFDVRHAAGFNLFKEIDNDNSGFVTFDELSTCVRRELKKGPKTISHVELKLLWCALDKDNDNSLDKEEMVCAARVSEQTIQ